MNLKITFDETSDAIAFVNHPGRKRPRKVKGRWIVFLRDRPWAGIFPEDIVFSAPTTRESATTLSTPNGETEMTTFNPETIEEKRAYLESLGYSCGERDARLNTNYPGVYMVAENDYADYELPTEDGSGRPWCVVGDDLAELIEDAFLIWFDESEAENLERAYRIATA